MPASLGKGSIEGEWLSTWAKLGKTDWTEKFLEATLTSNTEQTLTLRYRKPATSFRVNGKDMVVNGDHVQYSFAEGETIEIRITF